MNNYDKNSFSFSFFTALWLTLLAGAGLLLIQLFIFDFHLGSLLIFIALFFVISFLAIQIRTERIINNKIEKLHKNVSLLSDFPIDTQPITTDMESLTKRVEEFAQTKKLEIQALKIRENYRREFIGNVSHELKTPLFTVEGYILTILDGALEDKERTEKYLQRAYKGVERLIYIVNDLEMISKLESGELHLDKQRFDIVKVIETVFEMLEMNAEDQKISLTFDKNYKKPIWVEADEERIQQVITNLVMNSIKYGKAKGTTEISIENLPTDKIMVRISDNGEGFKKEDIPRLFERFFRVDKSGSRERGGSGLGLSIVKHILEAHHEKIYVESDYGIGSEFSFSLKKANKL